MTADTEPESEIDLARQPDFRLGGATVQPSSARVRQGAKNVRVQPRVMQVLIVFARRAGETVTRDELIDACWGGRIVTDDAVKFAVGQVRQLARGFDPPPFSIETVPRVGFRLVERPDGETAKESAPPLAKPAGHSLRLWAMAIGVIAIAAVIWLAWSAVAPGPDTKGNGQVEVIAFRANSADPETRRAADGVGEIVIRSLAGAGVGTAAAPHPRDSGGGASEFRVAGTVEREGESLVVLAQVLDRRSGLILWTDRFVGKAAEAERLTHNVADQIAFNLHCALEDRKGAKVPVSLEALGLYINTCAALDSASDTPELMLALSRKLVKAAPRYASAHAMHGIAAAWAAFGALSPEAEEQFMAEGRAAAETAIKLDPRTPKAYVAREMSRPNLDWAGRENDLVKALALDPDLPPPAIRYAKLLADVGRFRKAVEVARGSAGTRDPRGTDFDPREPTLLAAAGDLTGARAALDRADRVRPGYMDDIRWEIESWWGDPAKAPDLSHNAWNGAPAGEIACARAYLPRLAAAHGAPLKGLPQPCQDGPLRLRVRLTARQGDIDGAYALWTGERSPRSRQTIEYLYYPELRAFRADPRFRPLAEKLGLLNYWRQPGRRPDFCADPQPPPVCAGL